MGTWNKRPGRQIKSSACFVKIQSFQQDVYIEIFYKIQIIENFWEFFIWSDTFRSST